MYSCCQEHCPPGDFSAPRRRADCNFAKAEQLVSLSQVASLYTSGLAFFHERFVPHLKSVLGELSGGVRDLADFVAYAADSDVDLDRKSVV